MDLERLNPDSVEEIFARHGASSITFTDGGNEPVLEPSPGAAPLWRDTRITGLFAPECDLDALRDDLRRSLDIDELPAHAIDVLENRAWEREWLKDFAPMRFGQRLWIGPGDARVDQDDAVVVSLDPGLAFGTGTHATTALCLEWLDGLVLEGKTVLDVGCGSGVLAIAAVKLGCAMATGIDIDVQAIRATRENAARNHVEDRLVAVPAAEAIEGTFDVVVANILATTLIGHAAALSARTGDGCLLALSGILSDQVDDVLAAYARWIRFDDPVTREQDGQVWARLTGRRIEG